MAQSKENKKMYIFLKTTWDIVSKGNMAIRRNILNEETDQAHHPRPGWMGRAP